MLMSGSKGLGFNLLLTVFAHHYLGKSHHHQQHRRNSVSSPRANFQSQSMFHACQQSSMAIRILIRCVEIGNFSFSMSSCDATSTITSSGASPSWTESIDLHSKNNWRGRMIFLESVWGFVWGFLIHSLYSSLYQQRSIWQWRSRAVILQVCTTDGKLGLWTTRCLRSWTRPNVWSYSLIKTTQKWILLACSTRHWQYILINSHILPIPGHCDRQNTKYWHGHGSHSGWLYVFFLIL